MSIRFRAVCKNKDMHLIFSMIMCVLWCYCLQMDNFPLLPTLLSAFSFVETKLCSVN